MNCLISVYDYACKHYEHEHITGKVTKVEPEQDVRYRL